MITNALQRPTNFEINRLGVGCDWNVPTASSQLSRLYGFLNSLFLSVFVSIAIRSGEFFRTHPFFSKLFYYFNISTLPRVFTKDDLRKFYRPIRLKYTVRFRAKRNFFARKYLKNVNITNLNFLKLNGCTLVTLYVYIPEPIKRFSYMTGKASTSKISRYVIDFFNYSLKTKEVNKSIYFYYNNLKKSNLFLIFSLQGLINHF